MTLFGVWDDDPELSDAERFQRRAAEALASLRVIVQPLKETMPGVVPIAESYIRWLTDELEISGQQIRTAMLDVLARLSEERTVEV